MILTFLVLFALLQTLQGLSLPSSHENSYVANSFGFSLIARESPVAPGDGEQQFRTAYAILQSCLLTIFACVWKSAHPNINGPRDSGWTCMKRKIVTMLCALTAPELVLFWALCQHSAAKEIAEKYNKEFAKIGDTETSLWGKITGWFEPLPKDTTRRGNGQPWTATHGFFIQMGGFVLYENEYPKEVLHFDRLAQLLRDQAIDAPTVTERDLQDRSKGDTISKAIIVLQTTWFVFQCFARAGQRLPLSELEVLTLAFAVVNAAIYVAWWNKPQGVGMAICIPLKGPEKYTNDSSTPSMDQEQHELANLSQPEPISLPQLDCRHSRLYDDLPLIPSHEQEQHDEHIGKEHSWLRRKVRKDRGEYMSPFFLLLRLPYRIVGSVLRTLDKMGEAVEFEKKHLRVPMFYASGMGRSGSLLASCVIGTIFGAIHLIAWASEFPSHRDLVLWRVSAIVLTVAPVLLFLQSVTDTPETELIHACIDLLFVLLTPFYIAARFVLIIVALQAIRDPPRDVLVDVSWTSYLPHF